MKAENERVGASIHKLVSMHGVKAVITLVNIGGCEVEIEKDNTVIIL